MSNYVISILGAVLVLAACSPGDHKASASATKPAASQQASTGHTPRPVQQVPGDDLFHGYRCYVDCSRHQAGYEWGAEHKVENPKNCRGPNQSFIEGCWAYAGQDGPLGQREIFQDED